MMLVSFRRKREENRCLFYESSVRGGSQSTSSLVVLRNPKNKSPSSAEPEQK